MSDITISKLRSLAIVPTVGAVLAVVWVSSVGVINREIGDNMSDLGQRALNLYVPLLLTCYMVWALTRAMKQYRAAQVSAGSFADRYLRVSKAIAFPLLITMVSFLFLAGFTVFVSSFNGLVGSGNLIDRIVLSYLPVIIEAVFVFLGVFYGFVSKKRGNDA